MSPPPGSANRNLRIGLMTEAGSILYRRIFTGMFAYARETPGVQVAHWNLANRLTRQAITSLHLDGIIVGTKSDYEAIGRPDLPTICCGSYNRSVAVPRLCDDQVWIGTVAARHLLARGGRRFAYCGYRYHYGSRDRQFGFLAEVASSGFSCDSFTFESSKNQQLAINSDKEQEALKSWLKRLKKPSAILCFSDAVAVVVMHCLAQIGAKVPDDAAIVGIDNDPFSINAFPQALSSVDPGSAKTGYEAIRSLCRWIRTGVKPEAEARVANASLYARQTTGRYYAEDPLVSEFLDLIDAKATGSSSVQRLAKLVGCSRRTLERRVKRATGASVHNVMLHERLEKAKATLAEPDSTLKGVALEHGFSSAQKFCEVFKREFGVTPGAWRTARQS